MAPLFSPTVPAFMLGLLSVDVQSAEPAADAQAAYVLSLSDRVRIEVFGESDLSTIARSSDRARLLQSILQPSASIAPLYAVKAVTTKKGETFSGIPTAVDSSQGYHLLQPDGSLKKIARPDVAEVTETPVSLMPQGLENTMAVQDVRDLLAWMETLR